MKRHLLSLAVAGVCALPGLAQATSHTDAQPAPRAATRAADALTDGEVRKVDKDSGKLTIRHGAISNLDMPPMTMVFQVSDRALLDNVKTGDQIRFAAEKLGGAYTVTLLERK
jgi:Cu/Ag efflux protein CusF